MTRWVPPELNHPTPGGVLIVGRDPGSEEMRQGRPFVGAAGDQLERILRAAGIDRRRVNIANIVGIQPPGNDFRRHAAEDVQRGLRELDFLVATLRPNVIITLGNEAAWACVGDWPGHKDGSHASIMGARDIQRRRGYLWDGAQGTLHGAKVLTTLHPSAVMRDGSGISEMLATLDFERAWAERGSATLTRPRMDITVIRTATQASNAVSSICEDSSVACDIEITGGERPSVLCVGFAPTPQRAYVFPQAMLSYAYGILRNERIAKVWQNGQFDLHFLATRAAVHVADPLDDIIVAWHTRWPEIAGAALTVDGDRKGAKATKKSLAFFASLYSKAAWWKNYNVDIEGMLRLCGQDCCLTMQTHLALQQELDEMDLTSVYRLTMARVRPVATMQARGILIDEGRRRSAIAELDARADAALIEMSEIAESLFTEARASLPKPELIWHRKVCPCCRNGAGKRAACTSCAGLEDTRKPALLAAYIAYIRGNGGTLKDKAAAVAAAPKLSAGALKEAILRPCKVCGGRGEWEVYAFNPASSEQMSMLLYDVLKLPRRKGVDEASLKGLLGQVREVQQRVHARTARPVASASR